MLKHKELTGVSKEEIEAAKSEELCIQYEKNYKGTTLCLLCKAATRERVWCGSCRTRWS
jgi:hypothetical protein